MTTPTRLSFASTATRNWRARRVDYTCNIIQVQSVAYNSSIGAWRCLQFHVLISTHMQTLVAPITSAVTDTKTSTLIQDKQNDNVPRIPS